MKHFILLIILVLLKFNSLACSCIGTATTKQAFKGADVVFTGKVIEKIELRNWYRDTVKAQDEFKQFQIERPNSQETYQQFKQRRFSFVRYEYEFKILRTFKRKADNITFKVRTGAGGGDCGFRFQVNQEYLVYATNIKGDKNNYTDTYQTDICTKTTILANATDQLKELKKL